MEVRVVFVRGASDFRCRPEGVPVRDDGPEESAEPSCLVGDLLGDCHDC